LELHGHLSLHAAPRPEDGVTTLRAQSLRAPFHLSKPYWDADTRTLIVQVVNPTAGILSGDQLHAAVTVDSAAALLLTTPSASRVFKMRPGAASASATQHFTVASGAWLDVLPEPLVPHRSSRFHQRTVLEIAPGGAAFYADILFPGRLAHGEAWAWERLVLELEVRSGAQLRLRERFEHTGTTLRELAQLHGLGDEACFGNIVYFPPQAPAASAPPWREPLHALQDARLWVGASPLHGGAGWSIKLLSADGPGLREALAAVRRLLAAEAPHLACDARKL
jgi:urease accessory protein